MLCRYSDDPFQCDFHNECNQNSGCIVDQLQNEAELLRQDAEYSRLKSTQTPTLVGLLLENAAPANLVLSKMKKLLEKVGAVARIVDGDDGNICLLIGPFDSADNYIVTAMCGGGL